MPVGDDGKHCESGKFGCAVCFRGKIRGRGIKRALSFSRSLSCFKICTGYLHPPGTNAHPDFHSRRRGDLVMQDIVYKNSDPFRGYSNTEAFRFGKSELAIESPRLWFWDNQSDLLQDYKFFS